ncbi:serine/threonine protein phosphatase [Dokdonia pacifica]|uniref:Serine/threonine protein phosphatase 1 n=1 Tax=Dokdonia pacifica TaxID=1627892 RepID=A0A238ZPZ8_9FLAO|nr:metallophosphoesterase family protein [Dokdonia pacifica]GGG07577.1 serine/threonine protein phosphatase [Dokdonia pacifica]SNR84794.1 serine/threonine protein phosphatase 1 [Dokdonia pacifica]
MSRKICIGDIHGCVATFKALLEQLHFTKEDALYLLGDYIDRGPDSKGVIDYIQELQEQQYQVVALRGNHEQMLINDHTAETKWRWHDMGDEALLKSFGLKNLKLLPMSYIDFCNTLPFYHIDDTFIAVHAGVNFIHENPLENTEELMWIRNWYQNINYEWLQDKIIIHGHTPLTKYEIEAQFQDLAKTQVLNIDCGSFMSQQKESGLGYLCAFDVTHQKLYFQENIDENCKY